MNEIYNWLTYNKTELMNKYIYRMINNRDHAEDFYQDLYILVSDKNEEKMLGILDRGEMFAYFYIIIRNNLCSTSSRYYYTYRKPNPSGSDYDEVFDNRTGYDNIGKGDVLAEIEEEYENLNKAIKKYWEDEVNSNPKLFYDKAIFDMYYDDNASTSFRKLGTHLDIPSTSIYNTVTQGRNKILKRFKDEIKNINDKIIYYYTEYEDDYVYGSPTTLNYNMDDDSY